MALALSAAVGLLLVGTTASAAPNSQATRNALAEPTPDCTGFPCTPPKCEGLIRPPQSPLVDPVYEKSTAFLGTTPDEIQQKFAAIQELNFSRGNAQQVVSRLSDTELHDLAYFYTSSAPAGSSTLLRIFAKRLNGQSLMRIVYAFGSDATQSAVQSYAPEQVQADFAQRLAATPSVPFQAPSVATFTTGSGGEAMISGPAPTPDMTLYEIYLEFRTAPVGSMGPAAAISEAALYAGSRMYWVPMWAGYAFGTAIHDLIEEFDPALDDVIGGTIQQAVENIANALDEFEQGEYESGMDDLFGGPIDDTGDYSGDWDVGESYDYYETGSGGCS